MDIATKEKMFKELFLSTQEKTKYGFPLRFIRRLLWPFINSGQFYLLHQIIHLQERIERNEGVHGGGLGMQIDATFLTERLMTLTTDYLALKRAYFELQVKHDEICDLLKKNITS